MWHSPKGDTLVSKLVVTVMNALLRSFASCGFTLQSASTKTMLGLAAVVALGGGYPNGPGPVSGARGSLPAGAYAGLVERLQDRADTEFGFGRIAFLDRSAPARSEAVRLNDMLTSNVMASVPGLGTGAAHGLVRNASEDADTVESYRAYQISDGTTCIVAGPPPGATVDDVAGQDAADAGIGAVEAFRHSMIREVGHCLLPGKPVAAEAFAALVSLKRGDGGRMARAMAERAVDGDGADARMEGVLASVARLDGDALSNKGWTSLAALADSLAGVEPAKRREAADEPAATASVTARPDVPLVEVAHEEDDEEPAAPGFR